MKRILGAVLVTIVAASPAAAKPRHWHDSDRHPNKHARGDDDDDARDYRDADCRFWPRDVRIIRECYEPRYRALPPGLAKKYYRTGRLPPGWQKKMEPRGYIDGTVYSPRTHVIVDVVTVSRP